MTDEKFWTIMNNTQHEGGGDRERQSLALRKHFESSIRADCRYSTSVPNGWCAPVIVTDLWYAAMIIAGGTCHDDGYL